MIKNNNLEEFSNIINNIDNEENIVDIDTEKIDNDSIADAEKLIDNLQDIYADPEFMNSNPKFAARLSAEMEDLRILIKLRKSDEVMHDVLLASIGKNPGNASLYRALTDIQKTMLSTTTDLGDKIKGINNLLKTIQLEINFNSSGPQTTQADSQTNTFRGSKEFIKAMREEID